MTIDEQVHSSRFRFECLKSYFEYTFVTELENAQPAEKYKL